MRRKWRMALHFNNGTTCLFSVTLREIVAFIKETKAKNKGAEEHDTLPIELWLLDMVFDKAKNYVTTSLIDASIHQEN